MAETNQPGEIMCESRVMNTVTPKNLKNALWKSCLCSPGSLLWVPPQFSE